MTALLRFLRNHISVVFLFLSSSSLAQLVDNAELQYDESGKVSFGDFRHDKLSIRRLSDGGLFLKTTLKARDEDEFRLIRGTRDELGIIHQRYQQYYKGIKVRGGDYILHGKGNNIDVMNGKFHEINITSVNSSLSESAALSHALNYVGAVKYSWQDKPSEDGLKAEIGDPNATYFPKGELVICKDRLRTGKRFRLAWMFPISALEPSDALIVFVDSQNGVIIEVESMMCNYTQAEGPAASSL